MLSKNRSYVVSILDRKIAAGHFDEKVFRGLDWVLAEARKRGLRVMLVLVNYWAAYGGMAQYVK